MLIVGRLAGGVHPVCAANIAVEAATPTTKAAIFPALISTTSPHEKHPNHVKNFAPMIAGATPLTQIAIGRALERRFRLGGHVSVPPPFPAQSRPSPFPITVPSIELFSPKEST
jgi:hypothetical protein